MIRWLVLEVLVRSISIIRDDARLFFLGRPTICRAPPTLSFSRSLSISRFGDAWNIIETRCGFNLRRTTQVADEEESRLIKLAVDNTNMVTLWLFEVCLMSRPRVHGRFLWRSYYKTLLRRRDIWTTRTIPWLVFRYHLSFRCVMLGYAVLFQLCYFFL